MRGAGLMHDVQALLMAHMDDGREAGDPGEMEKPGRDNSEQNIVSRNAEGAAEKPQARHRCGRPGRPER